MTNEELLLEIKTKTIEIGEEFNNKDLSELDLLEEYETLSKLSKEIAKLYKEKLKRGIL